MKDIAIAQTTLCPSAQPKWEDSVVFGLISGTVTEPRLAYLKQPLPVTDELIAKASPVTPTEIFRTAAPCAAKGCQHFDAKDCPLAMRIVEKLPEVAEELPPLFYPQRLSLVATGRQGSLYALSASDHG